MRARYAKVSAMFRTDGHIAHFEAVAHAVMSEHFAMQCHGARQRAAADMRPAQQPFGASSSISYYYRYL